MCVCVCGCVWSEGGDYLSTGLSTFRWASRGFPWGRLVPWTTPATAFVCPPGFGRATDNDADDGDDSGALWTNQCNAILVNEIVQSRWKNTRYGQKVHWNQLMRPDSYFNETHRMTDIKSLRHPFPCNAGDSFVFPSAPLHRNRHLNDELFAFVSIAQTQFKPLMCFCRDTSFLSSP